MHTGTFGKFYYNSGNIHCNLDMNIDTLQFSPSKQQQQQQQKGGDLGIDCYSCVERVLHATILVMSSSVVKC